jgi:5-methyltetrahydropteroyltriglutamate--homocysteine methyltransferase
MAAPPFRAEVIGSLLRPRILKDTAVAIAKGEKAAGDYQEVLEREIGRVVARQEQLGLKVATDGEFGRTSWFGFFFEGLDGFRLEPSLFRFRDADGGSFEWPTCVAAGRIHRRAPITLAEYRRLTGFTRKALPKATLPTPSAFHFFRFTQPFDPAVYDQERYFDDLVAVYRSELAELARAGCTYVQMDEVPVAMLCDPLVREQARAQGGDPDALLDLYVGVMRRILSDRPAGVTVGMHLCRGNFRSRWMASGGYEPVAARLFNDFPVDIYFLEYDSQRAGDFSPLRHVPRDRRVVLGLVSSKTPVLESRDDLRRRLDEAATFVDLDRLSLSSQCGFASVAGGNSIDEDMQWAKLALIVDTAHAVWGEA